MILGCFCDGYGAGIHKLSREAGSRQHADAAWHHEVRPGPNGDEHAPNHANFDEANAGPVSAIPDALVLRNGTPVTKPTHWWKLRRPQIVEDFAREVYGWMPATMPEIRWTVISTEHKLYAGYPAVVRELRGRVTNPVEPSLSVELRMTVNPGEIGIEGVSR